MLTATQRFIRLAALAGLGLVVTVSDPVLAWDWFGFNSTKGSGIIDSTTRTLSGVKGIELELPAKVTLIQGDSEDIRIETDDNLLSLIETRVDNGVLRIGTAARSRVSASKDIRIVVHVRAIDRISISGSGDVHADRLQTRALNAEIAGSGSIAIASLETDTLEVEIAGSGAFSAGGKSDTVAASIAGSGEIDAGKLAAGSVTVDIAGSGEVTTWVSKTLEINVAGSGDVKYFGDAALSQSVVGSGSITRLGPAPLGS